MPTNSVFGSGHEVVTSTTRPGSPLTGQLIYESDTQKFNWYTGSIWTGLVPAGVISAHVGTTAPDGWLLCYGQAVSRSAYPELLTALGGLTVTSPGTRTSVSSTITGMTGMLPTYVGLSITGYAVQPGTVIASVIDSTSITLSNPTASLPTSTATYTIGGLIYGNGDGSTTFNVPDMRGVRPAGADNMGGSSAGRLDYTAATSLGTLLGSQYMAAHTHTYSLSGTSGNDSPDHAHQWPLAATQGGRDGNDIPARSMYGWDVNFRTGWRAVGGYNAADRPHTHTLNWYGSSSTDMSGSSGNMPPSMVLSYVIKY